MYKIITFVRVRRNSLQFKPIKFSLF